MRPSPLGSRVALIISFALAPVMAMSADEKSTAPVTGQAFAQKAAVIGKAEIELGKLAMTNSQDTAVRDFGSRMVEDHTAAAAKLKSAAAADKISLPAELDAKHAALKTKLSGLKGEAFDKEYAKAMAKGHDEAVALFESATQSPTVPAELKEFAASTLPTLESHQKLAHTLHSKEGA
jgi:putative membrane protein